MAGADQARAWDGIEEVRKPAGWCECHHCGGKLFAASVTGLPRGTVRLACTGCMQRYNYTATEAAAGDYTGFGSF